METHSSILALKILGSDDPGPWGCKELDKTKHGHELFYS